MKLVEALASIRAHLAILMLVVILPCAMLVVYQNLHQRDSDVDRARADSVQLTHVLASQYEETQAGRQQPTGLDDFAKSASDPERCAAVTRALLKEFKQYQNIGVADLNGRLMCSGLSGQANIADRDYFKIALATNSFAEGTYQVGGTAESPSISYAYPVRNPSGTTFAIMFATVDLSWFNRGLAKISLPSGSTVTLFDRTGVALARFPEPADFVGKSFSDSDLLITPGPERRHLRSKRARW